MTELINGIPLYDIIGMLGALGIIAVLLASRVGREPDTYRDTTSARNPDGKARMGP